MTELPGDCDDDEGWVVEGTTSVAEDTQKEGFDSICSYMYIHW